MGSSTSKAARTAAGATRRQYPTKIPQNTSTVRKGNAPPAQTGQGPTVYPEPHATEQRDQVVDLDARDPDFARSLRSLGPAQTPSPTYSPSSTFNTAKSQPGGVPGHQQQIFPSPATNPAIQILEARSRLAKEAEDEFANIGRQGAAGRKFLDVMMIRQVLVLRDEKNLKPEQIEKQLGLAKGVVDRLGPRGVVGDVGGVQGTLNQGVELV